jgi:predicted metal-binding protein
VIRQGAALYRDAPAGLVPWRERPEHFRRNSIARIPPLEIPNA